ncbi:MAG: hypothetical protein GAK28_03226 [Luteibacter sp.]|uniref:tail completion protein gp17 n=1 Tax=Luteibacter sp. TaxID=1886636 RepID=UPI0013826E96|nr:DUF3168 domain-containing protein [Luteibacter sp.]KAF1005474.1 MAG: hypothetical protein GAK28_03226 [Luteibacter sp.]
MSIKSAVYAAIKDVVATFPVVAPQGTKPPYLRYSGIGDRDESTYDADGMGATSGTIQIDSFALSYADAVRNLAAARAALYASPGVTVGEIVGLPDDYEGDTKLFKVSMQVEAWE